MTASGTNKSSFAIIVLTLLVGLSGDGGTMAFLHPATSKNLEPGGSSSVRAVLQLETFTVDMSSADQNPLHRRAPGLDAVEAYYSEFLMQR